MAIQAALINKSLSVTAKVSSTGTLQASNPVTVKGFAARLDSLNDVDSRNETNGAVPVYSSNNDTYVIRQLELGDLGGAIDGGTF